MSFDARLLTHVLSFTHFISDTTSGRMKTKFDSSDINQFRQYQNFDQIIGFNFEILTLQFDWNWRFE